MGNGQASASEDVFSITINPKPHVYPMTIDAGEVDAQVFRIEALAEACEVLIWNNNALNEAGRNSGAGPLLELISLIRQELSVLGSRVST